MLCRIPEDSVFEKLKILYIRPFLKKDGRVGSLGCVCKKNLDTAKLYHTFLQKDTTKLNKKVGLYVSAL